MIIGFTGTRQGCTPKQLVALTDLLASLGMTEAHHGDCIGADDEFARIADWMLDPRRIYIHPPVDETHRAFHVGGLNNLCLPKTYFARNRDIVNASDLLVGCPLTMQEQSQGGTFYTINYARKVGKPVRIVWPDGSVTDGGSVE